MRRSLTNSQWREKKVAASEASALASALGVPPLVARVLAARGLGEAESARLFLASPLDSLSDPACLADLPEAVELLCEAIRRERRIRIYGDYDVNGVAGTALLTRALRKLTPNVDWYIPHRLEEGYGLSAEAV